MPQHHIIGPDWTDRNPFAAIVASFPRFRNRRVRDLGLLVLQSFLGALFFFVISFSAIALLIAERAR